MALETEFEERFAQDTVGYLREIEAQFSVKIQRIAIDAPSDTRSADAEGRQGELALRAAHISYFETPSWAEFEEINRQIEKHVSGGGREWWDQCPTGDFHGEGTASWHRIRLGYGWIVVKSRNLYFRRKLQARN